MKPEQGGMVDRRPAITGHNVESIIHGAKSPVKPTYVMEIGKTLVIIAC